MTYAPRRPHPKGPKSDRQPDSSSIRHRALVFLAGCPDGCMEGLLLVNGFTVELLVELVRDGLASASPERVVSGRETIEVARVRITETGRRVLGGVGPAGGRLPAGARRTEGGNDC